MLIHSFRHSESQKEKPSNTITNPKRELNLLKKRDRIKDKSKKWKDKIEALRLGECSQAHLSLKLLLLRCNHIILGSDISAHIRIVVRTYE